MLVALLALAGLGATSLGGCSVGFSNGSSDSSNPATESVADAGVASPTATPVTDADGMALDAGVASDDVTSGDDNALCGATPACEPDPGATSGCPTNAACRVFPADAGAISASASVACVAAGAGQDGDACRDGTDCGAGLECVGTPGKCRAYCCHGACDAAHFCDAQPVTSATSLASTKVPVCSPVEPCTLLVSQGCGADETCAVVSSDGTTSCVATGGAKAGGACDVDHCAAGLVCLGPTGSRTCYALCSKSDADGCGAGQACKGTAPLFKDPDVGICDEGDAGTSFRALH